MDELLEFVGAHPEGVSAGVLESRFSLSRSTLNRRLAAALEAGVLTVSGKGPATRYYSADRFAALRAYFSRPHTERIIARFREELLSAEPALSVEALATLGLLPEWQMDRRTLAKFLIDFSCASSVLEGGTYSLLDTQALLEYGEKSAGKPLADAFLVLNHKEAFEYLYENPRLDAIFKIHDLLTNDHGLPQLAESPHFLSQPYRGVLREYKDVDIALSTYLPPFRPGTGYLGRMLDRILEQAEQTVNPVAAAFYLLTRLPYLQPFADGNKRTSRALCNVPLLQAKLPPISFVDFVKKDYIIALLAFYELGDVRLAEQCFTAAYVKSIARLGIVAPSPNITRL